MAVTNSSHVIAYNKLCRFSLNLSILFAYVNPRKRILTTILKRRVEGQLETFLKKKLKPVGGFLRLGLIRSLSKTSTVVDIVLENTDSSTRARRKEINVSISSVIRFKMNTEKRLLPVN